MHKLKTREVWKAASYQIHLPTFRNHVFNHEFALDTFISFLMKYAQNYRMNINDLCSQPTSLGLRDSWLNDWHVQTWEGSCLSHLVIKINPSKSTLLADLLPPLVKVHPTQKEISQRKDVQAPTICFGWLLRIVSYWIELYYFVLHYIVLMNTTFGWIVLFFFIT